ncbi:putative heat shock protein [Hibiscus syriacus]|uniref:Heat shock protein n=1 Tax=Hibiscus syriacus TaxID=106335 RepID=A0A6A2XXH6_HIBSY|nr:putative heat shock protein [Hibiscus syriacus]
MEVPLLLDSSMLIPKGTLLRSLHFSSRKICLTFVWRISGDSRPDNLKWEILSRPPDINLPLSADRSPPPQQWNLDQCDILNVGLSSQVYETESYLAAPKTGRKFAKRVDSIWGAWLSEVGYFYGSARHGEYVHVGFKERPENALGKMQLRSYMNGHSRLGERPFPFSVDKGFVRSHRMQRKHYRGLSNPQCVHGIEVVPSSNLMALNEDDRKRWTELTGRDINFTIPPEASDFSSWRNLPNTDFELERSVPPPSMKSVANSHSKRLLNGTGLNLSTQPPSHSNGDGMDSSLVSSKRRKQLFPHGNDDDCYLSAIPLSERIPDMEIHPVSWRNTLTHGIIKISCVSTSGMPFIKRHDRTFKLTDSCTEHCPTGQFFRQIPLSTRIPEDANIEAYHNGLGSVLEILVPKLREVTEEHEVLVCLRPRLVGSDLMLT